MTDYPKSLAEALAILQTRLPEIKRSELAVIPTKSGDPFSYTYANLANISQEILPMLGELGLSFIAKPTLNADGKFVLAYKLLHVSGEFEPGEYQLDGSTPQAKGSSITYARRQCLCAVTGVAPAEDDDDAAKAQVEAATRGTVQRRPVAHPAPRTVGEASDRPTVQRAPKPPLPSDDPLAADRKEMHTLLTNLGMSETERREWIIDNSGHQITSTKELTGDEITELIDKAKAIGKAREKGQ